jgi:putative nucleotidyltransferase with HDIG domain
MTSSGPALRDPLHLVRRWWKALCARPLSAGERDDVRNLLAPDESELFFRFATHDQRHALEVLGRLDMRHGAAPIAVRRAALLHDIGKIDDDLSVALRVVASIVGPRGRRFVHYHAHEMRGAEMLRAIGSDPLTVDLVAGTRSDGADIARWAAALRDADRV